MCRWDDLYRSATLSAYDPRTSPGVPLCSEDERERTEGGSRLSILGLDDPPLSRVFQKLHGIERLQYFSVFYELVLSDNVFSQSVVVGQFSEDEPLFLVATCQLREDFWIHVVSPGIGLDWLNEIGC